MNYSYEEIQNFVEERRLATAKMGKLRQAYILETNAAVQFKLDIEIKQLETHIADLDQKIAAGYDLGTDSGKERLRRVVANLKISEDMGPEHLVNCNRDEVRERFEMGFDERRNRGDQNHYYFISACPKQLPPSVGERMIYEWFAEMMDKDPQAVYFRTESINHDRVKLEKFPLGYSLEKSQEMFREFCAEWFRWDDHLSFNAAIAANRLPLDKCRFVVIPFYLRKKDWKPFFPEYFNWIHQKFSARKGGPVLLFFFVFYHENLHITRDEKSNEILQAIDGLCENYISALDPQAQSKGHFYPLMPVEENDLRYWFNDLGEHNDARIDPVIKTLAESLPPEEAELYRRETKFNMDRIEIVQEITFEQYNR
ncbi:MAG: hypothetical protein JNJ57_10960 [Saprospiraceae bacterium]|nr:hypothetical protein [Saprospiraceae bacterium]